MNDYIISIRFNSEKGTLDGDIKATIAEVKALNNEVKKSSDAFVGTAQAVEKWSFDLTGAGAAAKDTSGKVADLANKSEEGANKAGLLGAAFGSLGGMIAAVGFTALAAELLSVNTEFSSLRASLETVTGSQAAANIEFGKLQDFAATTPFSLQEVTEAFIKMKALGLDPSQEALTSYGNTASAMGKSLNQMIEAVADAATGEFERLKEFGIKAKTEGDQVSLTFQGVTTTIGNNAAEIEGYLQAIGNVEFAGAMDRQSQTLAGAISNIGDAWDNLLDKILSGALEQLVVAAIQAVSALLNIIGAAAEAVNKGITFALDTLGLWGDEADDAKSSTVALGDAADAGATSVKQFGAEAESSAKSLEDLNKQAKDAAITALGVEFVKSSNAVSALKVELEKNIKALQDYEAAGGNSVEVVNAYQTGITTLNQQLVDAEDRHDSLTAALGVNSQAMTTSKDKTSAAAGSHKTLAEAVASAKEGLEAERVKLVEGEAAAYRFQLGIDGIKGAEADGLVAKWQYNNALAEQKEAQEAANAAFTSSISALAAEYVELTQGERAAYAYGLAMQGVEQAEIDAALAIWDANKSLRDQKDAADEAVKANKDAGDQFAEIWNESTKRVDNLFLDLWTGAFDSAADFGESLKDWFIGLLAEMAHAAITRPIVMQIGAMMSGGMAAGGAQAGGMNLSGIGSGGSGGMGGDLLNMVLGGGGLWGSVGGWLSGMAGESAFLGAMGSGMLGGSAGLVGMFNSFSAGFSAMMSGSIGSGLGAMIGAALPVLLPLLLVPLLSSAFGDDNANSEIKLWTGENFAGGGNAAQIGTGKNWASEGEWVQVDTPFGALGAGGRHIGQARDDQIPQEEFDKWLAQMKDAFEAIGQLDQVIVDVFGLTDETIASITAQVEAMEESVKKMGTPDIEGFLAERYKIIFGGIGGTAGTIFNNMLGTSGDVGTTKVVQDLTAFYATIKGYKNVSADFDKMLADSQMGMMEAADAQKTSIMELINGYDGSYDKTVQLTAAMQARYQTELQMLAQVEAAAKNISATIGNAREQISLSLMTDEEKYTYYIQQAQSSMASISNMTDPAQIQAAVQAATNYAMQAWQLGGDAGNATWFQEFLDSLDTASSDQLAVAEKKIKDDNAALAAALETALNVPAMTFDDAAKKSNDAADKNQESADKLADAVDKFGLAVEGYTANAGVMGSAATAMTTAATTFVAAASSIHVTIDGITLDTGLVGG